MTGTDEILAASETARELVLCQRDGRKISPDLRARIAIAYVTYQAHLQDVAQMISMLEPHLRDPAEN